MSDGLIPTFAHLIDATYYANGRDYGARENRWCPEPESCRREQALLKVEIHTSTPMYDRDVSNYGRKVERGAAHTLRDETIARYQATLPSPREVFVVCQGGAYVIISGVLESRALTNDPSQGVTANGTHAIAESPLEKHVPAHATVG